MADGYLGKYPGPKGGAVGAGTERLLETEELQGERRANQARLIIAALFVAIFVAFYLKSERHYTASYAILAALVGLLLYAVILQHVLNRRSYRSSLKYLSSFADTTCITTLAIASLFLSSGLELQGWITNIAVFLLFIAISGLRFSPGLCLFTGVITAVDFLLLNLFVYVAGGRPLPPPQLVTIAILLLASGGIIGLTARMARDLIVRASEAERQQVQLAFEADEARRIAITDDLTGLHNRRYFMAELKRDLSHSARYQRSLAVLIIDLDYFKQVNDTLGHLAGDLVIRQVAGTLRQYSRETDVVARYGGDEFSLVLDDADPQQALTAAERLCRAVREQEFEVDGDAHDFRLSLSIGLSCFPSDATDVEGLLRAADRAVYRAKALGRDQVVCASALVESGHSWDEARL